MNFYPGKSIFPRRVSCPHLKAKRRKEKKEKREGRKGGKENSSCPFPFALKRMVPEDQMVDHLTDMWKSKCFGQTPADLTG